jgi:hypothetical protein
MLFEIQNGSRQRELVQERHQFLQAFGRESDRQVKLWALHQVKHSIFSG